MTTHCPIIVNSVINSEKDSYLELGINDRVNLNSIRSLYKTSVDINRSTNPSFVGTTDSFFEANTNRFDFIFIDANHDYDFVVRDLINSSKIANKLIVLHDMNPPTEYYTHPGQCSDSYKLLALLKKETDIQIYTLNEDYGLSFVPVLPNSTNINLSSELIEKYRNLSYAEFVSYRNENIKLYTTEEMIAKLKEVIASS